MSTHEAKTIKIEKIEPHPDPETINLGITNVWGYQIVVNKHQWKEGDLAVYVEPDTICDGARAEFSFLNKEADKPQKHRIKARRLRGVYSEGLLVPAPAGLNEGDDAWGILGLERYEPEVHGKKGVNMISVLSGQSEKGPELNVPKYDLENLKKFKYHFSDDDNVIVSTKINGTNSRWVWHNGKMYCGSRTLWKKEGDNTWRNALAQNPWIEEWCKEHPDYVLFGEVYGRKVGGKFHYGKKDDELGVAIFDIMTPEGKWMNNEDVFGISEFGKQFVKNVQLAPVLYVGKWDYSFIQQEAEKQEPHGHVREGVVVKLMAERQVLRGSRIAYKYVSNNYLLKD